MNSTRLLCSALLMALLTAACVVADAPALDAHAPGARPSPTPVASTPAATVAQLTLPGIPADQLVREGQLLVCSDLPFPPQEFFDEKGEPTGSDIELGEEIAQRLGLAFELINTSFDTIIEAANAGLCDIVISAQNITAEREAQIDMIPYFQAGQAFVLRAGNPAGVHTQLDLCGRRVAIQAGTVQQDVVLGSGEHAGRGLSQFCEDHQKEPISLHAFEKDDEALDALRAGMVDLYFLDSPAAGYHVVKEPDNFALSGLTLDVAVQGISVPSHRPAVRAAVEAALASMMDDGTYLAILAHFGVQDGSVAGTARP